MGLVILSLNIYSSGRENVKFETELNRTMQIRGRKRERGSGKRQIKREKDGKSREARRIKLRIIERQNNMNKLERN